MDEIKDDVQDKRKELQKRIDKLCAVLNKSFLGPTLEPEYQYSGLVFEPETILEIGEGKYHLETGMALIGREGEYRASSIHDLNQAIVGMFLELEETLHLVKPEWRLDQIKEHIKKGLAIFRENYGWDKHSVHLGWASLTPME